MADDGSLAAEQMSGREIVTTALALLRANYVFPERAEQAAAAVEARLAAGEYDDLDEITLTELADQPPAGSHRGQAPEIAARRRSRPRRSRPRRSRPRRSRPGGPGRRSRPGPGGPGPRPRAPAVPALGPAGPRWSPGATRPGGWPCGRWGRLDNFGIRRVERLDGNVGYLDVRRVPVPAQRRAGHHRGDGAGRGDLRAHHRPAAQRRRLAGRRGVLVQLPGRPSRRPTSTTSSTPTPARPGSSGPCRTCRAPATSTARSTC